MDKAADLIDFSIMPRRRATPLVALSDAVHLVTCGHFREMPEHHMARPRPDDYLILWVVAGRGHARAGRETLDAAAGDLLLFRPGVPHAYGSSADQPWEILWAHATGDAVADLVTQLRGEAGLRVALGLDAALRDRFLDLVTRTGQRLAHAPNPRPAPALAPASRALSSRPGSPAPRAPDADPYPHTEVLSILGLMARRLRQLQQAPHPRRAAAFDPDAVRRYIHDHLRRRLTLPEIAAHAHLSTAHFHRLFREHFGVSPIHYVNQQRVAAACDMLTQSPMKLWQVAAAVGFDDPYYFSRLFKRIAGLSPADYRRRHGA